MPRKSREIDGLFAEMDRLAALADSVLDEPQRTIWARTTDPKHSQTSVQIAAELGLSEQLVRYHRAQANRKVNDAYTLEKQGELRYGVTVEQGGGAKFKEDRIEKKAVENAARSRLLRPSQAAA